MALEDVVKVEITREARAIERAGFGTMLHLSMHRAWANRIRLYTKASELLADGFADPDESHRAAQSHFSQTPKPERIAVGRLATGDTVTVQVDTVGNSTLYTVFIDGIGFAFVSDATATLTEIEAGLTAIINGGYAITAVVQGTKTFTIAGNHVVDFPAGEQFAIDGSTGNDGTFTVVSATLVGSDTEIVVSEVIPDATVDGAIKSKTPVTATNASPGDGFLVVDPDTPTTFFRITASSNLHLEFVLSGTIEESLVAIEKEDAKSWYAVDLSHQFGGSQKDRNLDIATSIETRRKLNVTADADETTVSTTVTLDSPTSGSLARQLQAKKFARTAVLFGRQADNLLGTPGAADPTEDPFAAAGWLGSRLPTDPGSETWKFATLVGVVSDNLDTTERKNALDKNANVYVPITADRDITEEGTVAEGEFIDVIRFIDFLHSELTVQVFEAIANPPPPLVKTPFTDAGIAVVENAVREVLEAGVVGGGLASFTVTVPAAADVSAADKLVRVLRNVVFTAQLAGAIHAVEIEGFVTV